MVKKHLDVDEVSNGVLKVTNGPGIWYVVIISVLGIMVYRSGYRTGAEVSRKILRRHDKDVRRMKKDATKREKQLRKELALEAEKQWKW